MAVFKVTLTSTQRAFSRSCTPLLPVTENGGGVTKIFPRGSDSWTKIFAVALGVAGLTTSTFCSRQLSSEKKNCSPLKRFFLAWSGPEPEPKGRHDIVDDAKEYVSVTVEG